jgi:Macrocin-O-methyltransferase (TylF)
MKDNTDYELISGPRRSELWMGSVFKQFVASPNTYLASTFETGTPMGDAIAQTMREVEVEFETGLVSDLVEKKVPGVAIEFGTSTGQWINRIWEISQKVGFQETIFGLDSFEGLPEPSENDPGGYWKKGDYADSLERVREYTSADSREQIKLVKGWFSDSLATTQMQAVKSVAYARVDGDLYSSAVDCLNWLTGRISDGAVLYFDEWTFDMETGETRAFVEWVQRNPDRYKFTHLATNHTNHIYFRVNHLK